MNIITANLSYGYLTNEIKLNDPNYIFYYTADSYYLQIIKRGGK